LSDQVPESPQEAKTGPDPREKARRMLMLVALAFGVWFILRGVTGLLVPPVPDHPVQEVRMRVIAHRGGKGEFPENTLFAFRSAVAMGVDAIEMDVHLSSDGKLVVIHDDSVFRTTSGEGPVAELSLADIQSFDAGYWWPSGRKEDCEACLLIPDDEFPFRGRGIRVPSLEEVLAEFPDIPKIIEMKPEDPAIVSALGNLLRSYDQEESAIVASFHSANLKAFRQEFPEFATSAGQSEVTWFYVMNLLGFGTSYPSRAEFFQVPINMGRLPVITRGFLESSGVNNVRVQAWTINDRAEMEMLLGIGVDGIITDEPALLLDVLGR
jgi:glycerophosphoryl diester phosphodiesterase